jgi:hypothetical protein
MQTFRTLKSVDICKQIFSYLSSYNFVQEITAQVRVLSSPVGNLLIRVHTKFTLPFLDIPTSFYEFRKFALFF